MTGSGSGAQERYDFHLHTRCSDGVHAPREALALAARAGLSGVSITDHDTADAYREMAGAGGDGPRVLPGIEVSAACDEMEVHVLGYFPGGLPPGVESLADRLVRLRQERIREGVRRLAGKGYRLEWEDVLAEASGRVVSRGHLAQALVRKRYLPSIYAAFPRLLGPETVEPPGVDAPAVVEEIRGLGGIPVWAHPAPAHLPRFLDGLRRAGLRGVELHTPRRRQAEARQIRERIAGLGLLVSGGSDWHGYQDRDPLGRFSVGREEVGEFLKEIGWA